MPISNLKLSTLISLALLLFVNAGAYATNSAQLAVGTALLAQHKSEEAAAIFHRMLEQDPNDGLVWEAYGRALDEANQSKKAIAALTQAITLGRKESNVYHYRGLAYAHGGNFPSAITDYNSALKTGMPGWSDYQKADLHTDRADAEFALRQFDAAVKDYSSALTLQPAATSTGDRISRRARCYASLGKLKEAIDDMNKCVQVRIKTHSHVAGAYLYRAELYTQAKDYDKAILDYTTALSLDPGHSAVIRQRAKVYELMGKQDLANKDKKAADKADSDQF
jgi:tetratricopeptide (TPR) repeat protein